MFELFIFALLIALSGFFSATEIAFFSLNVGSVRTMVRHRVRGAYLVERLKHRPRRLLITILLGNNVVNILAAALATEVAIGIFGSIGVGIATGAVTILVLIFGEIFPKAFAQEHAAVLARMTAPVLMSFEYVLFPLVWMLEQITRLTITHAPHRSRRAAAALREEIHSLVQIGTEQGAVDAREQEIVERALVLKHTLLTGIMTPIGKVVMIEADAVIDQVSHFVAHSGYSRFPVYRGDKTNAASIIGVVHVKDLYQANNSQRRDQTVASVTPPALFLPPHVHTHTALRAMLHQKKHHALIRDDSDMLIGFVTLEDILEELIGEIDDEFDA